MSLSTGCLYRTQPNHLAVVILNTNAHIQKQNNSTTQNAPASSRPTRLFAPVPQVLGVFVGLFFGGVTWDSFPGHTWQFLHTSAQIIRVLEPVSRRAMFRTSPSSD